MKEASSEHIKGLSQAGFQKKFAHYQKGTVFHFGKIQITVVRVYSPLSTSVEDFDKKLVHPDWYVECSVLSTHEASEAAAASLLELAKILSDRVILSKIT